MTEAAGTAGRSEEAAALRAAQAALAAEHAAVYGYGVLGGRLEGRRRTDATAAHDAHRARRDTLVRTVRDLGGTPVAADAAYALPFAVPDPSAAMRLAAVVEDRVAGVYVRPRTGRPGAACGRTPRARSGRPPCVRPAGAAPA
ncbi:protein of unknown function [Streptomyces sp. DpondAA-F4a]|nr:protein of unknown function [Streptomyces sp. DpondAA-F4a]